MNLDQINRVAGGSIGFDRKGTLYIYHKGEYTGVKFPKDQAEKAMAFDRAINGPQAHNGGTSGAYVGDEASVEGY